MTKVHVILTGLFLSEIITQKSKTSLKPHRHILCSPQNHSFRVGGANSYSTSNCSRELKITMMPKIQCQLQTAKNGFQSKTLPTSVSDKPKCDCRSHVITYLTLRCVKPVQRKKKQLMWVKWEYHNGLEINTSKRVKKDGGRQYFHNYCARRKSPNQQKRVLFWHVKGNPWYN